MKGASKLLFLFLTYLSFGSARRVEFYRRDYTYVKQFDAYYKMHWSQAGISWNSAFQACDEEEATLFYPKLFEEWKIAHNLTLQLKEAPNVTDIFVGVHDKFGIGEFMTVDGHSFNFEPEDQDINNNDAACLTLNIENGKYRAAPCTRFPYTPLPFICKKNDYEYCPTIDPGYRYVKSLKKCYKINQRTKTWDQAVRSCYMEGGILIVLQNSVEADTIKDLLKEENTEESIYHSGINRIHRFGDFYTITGQNIKNVYYNHITQSEESNSYDCSAIYYQNNNYIYIKDIECDTQRPYICEMDTQ